jgi:ATP-dependent exoDNAse (exonuclease V) beta subunit
MFSILKLIQSPFENEVVAETYNVMAESGFLNFGKYDAIVGCEGSFIAQDNDLIEDKELSKFHWDMNYWLSLSGYTIDELALKIGLNYFSGGIEKSNIFLISTLISKISDNNFRTTLQRLEDLSNKPSLSGFKFFAPEDENEESYGKVQIMTLHKSKGDEFDYVFLPEMSERNLTLDINELSLKKSSEFMEQVRSLKEGYRKKNEFEQKKEIIAEDFRLLYVAITRAKRRLYISVPQKEKFFGRMKEVEPSIIFKNLLEQNLCETSTK